MNVFENTMQKRSSEDAIFFGDWHGDLSYAITSLERVIERYPHIDTYYHVGDFGVWGDNNNYLDAVSGVLLGSDKILVVTGGNHENWNIWDEWVKCGNPYYYSEALIFLPKVAYWEHGGRKYLSVGGASSIDQYLRVPGKSWWPQEEIHLADVCRVENANKEVDVLITHESSNDPVLPVRQVLSNYMKQMMWPENAKKLSEIQRIYVSRVFDSVKPKIHVHGHWHLPYIADRITYKVVSLGDNRTTYSENSWVLDKESEHG